MSAWLLPLWNVRCSVFIINAHILQEAWKRLPMVSTFRETPPQCQAIFWESQIVSLCEFVWVCVCVSFKNERIEDQQRGKTWANRRLQAYRSPHMSEIVSAIALEWEERHPRPFPTLWCEDGAGREQTMGRQEHSEHHLPVHRLLNHSFKATQLKSGSFRVTVDGVPKALDVLHKEK